LVSSTRKIKINYRVTEEDVGQSESQIKGKKRVSVHHGRRTSNKTDQWGGSESPQQKTVGIPREKKGRKQSKFFALISGHEGARVILSQKNII